jgi:hypothetical protein
VIVILFKKTFARISIAGMETYKQEIRDLKSDPTYKALMIKQRRNASEEKQLERYKLRISACETKCALLVAEEEKKAAVVAKAVAVVPAKYLRHPKNPAIERLATARNPDGPQNMRTVVDRSRVRVDRTAHKAILESNALESLVRQPSPVSERKYGRSYFAKDPEVIIPPVRASPVLTDKQRQQAKYGRSINKSAPEPIPEPVVENKYGRFPAAKDIKDIKEPETSESQNIKNIKDIKDVKPRGPGRIPPPKNKRAVVNDTPSIEISKDDDADMLHDLDDLDDLDNIDVNIDDFE